MSCQRSQSVQASRCSGVSRPASPVTKLGSRTTTFAKRPFGRLERVVPGAQRRIRPERLDLGPGHRVVGGVAVARAHVVPVVGGERRLEVGDARGALRGIRNPRHARAGARRTRDRRRGWPRTSPRGSTTRRAGRGRPARGTPGTARGRPGRCRRRPGRSRRRRPARGDPSSRSSDSIESTASTSASSSASGDQPSASIRFSSRKLVYRSPTLRSSVPGSASRASSMISRTASSACSASR